MKKLNEYIIQFSGLSAGMHEFEYTVDNTFFEQFEYSAIQFGKVDVHINMIKDEGMMVFEFEMDGKVRSTCDRCNDPLDVDVDGDARLIVKFGEEFDEESDEVIIIPETEHEINMAQYIYEYISLLLPMHKTHDTEDACNQEAISQLYASREEEEETDPRLDALKKLKK